MGSAASVKKYCEDLCCPEKVELLDSYIKNNSNFIQENENPSYDKDNSIYNQKNTSIFMLNNENNISNSLINNEKDEEKRQNNKDNKINLNFQINSFKEKNIVKNGNKHVIFESPKKSSPISTRTFKPGSIKISNSIKNKFKNKTNTVKMNQALNIYDDKKKNIIASFEKTRRSKFNQNKKLSITYINGKHESKLKLNFEEENNKKNQTNILIYPKNEEAIFGTEVVKCNSTNLIKTLIDNINVSEESFRSVKLNSNKFQDQIPKLSIKGRPLDNDIIKGNFLLKKMKFKYRGNKDSEGKKIGFGIILYEDSSKIVGNFYDSKINGWVNFYNCCLDKSTFAGEYINNFPNGYGIYSRKGLKLEGMNWYKNYINDIGIAIWDEGDIYEGEFKDNLKEGIGVYKWEDGASYMGYFKNNQINGYGCMNFANGNSYIGEFHDGYLSGWGKFIWEDNKCYIGTYKKNKKDGFGIFIWSYQPLIALIGFWEKGQQIGLFVKLLKGTAKYYFYQKSNENIEIASKGDICRYLRPSQEKYKNFLKKSYEEFEYFIRSSTKF